jgi:hypothetical protein
MKGKINIDRITLKKLIVWFKDYAKTLNITVVVNNLSDNCYAFPIERIIHLNIKENSKKALVFAFFHEVGHIIALDKGVYVIASTTGSLRDFLSLTKKQQKIFVLTGLKLEQWCDIYGEKEALKHFTNPHCYKPYFFQYGKTRHYEKFCYAYKTNKNY